MKKVLLDIIPVVVGILLALMLNGIRENYNSKKYLTRSIEAMILETDENITELEYALERQDRFKDTLLIYYKSDTVSLADIVQKARGYYSPDLKLTSWRFLIEDSKHTLIPYEMISLLTDIEKHHRVLDDYNRIIDSKFYTESLFFKKGSNESMLVLVNDMMSDEKILLESLEKFKTYINENQF